MKITDIRKKEWKDIFNMYVKEKNDVGDELTIERLLEFTRRCESCGEFVLVDDVTDELPVCRTWKGEEVHCCEECFKDIMSDNEFTDDYDYYQDYMDHKLVSE